VLRYLILVFFALRYHINHFFSRSDRTAILEVVKGRLTLSSELGSTVNLLICLIHRFVEYRRGFSSSHSTPTVSLLAISLSRVSADILSAKGKANNNAAINVA
jgi:hypothetical protein